MSKLVTKLKLATTNVWHISYQKYQKIRQYQTIFKSLLYRIPKTNVIIATQVNVGQ